MNTDKIFLNQQRLQGDNVADALVHKYFQDNRQNELYGYFSLSPIEILHDSKNNEISNFLRKVREKPVWYNHDRILLAQQLFETYAMEMMTLLGAMALPYCYAGTPGNKALYLSEKMRQSPGKRLADTADFIINVSTQHTLSETGVGHIHINKTRLIHAVARYYVKQANWNMQWGLPINQEDMAATNLAFSYVILIGLQKSGFVLNEKQKEDFIYLWRYIGYQLNITEELLPTTFPEAHRLTMLMQKRHFKKSAEGVALCQSLIQYYKTVVPSDKAYFIEAQIKHLLGDEIASYIGLKPEFMIDKINALLFTFSELQNFFSIHKSTYEVMLRNQRSMSVLQNKN
jgi:hypothetical protein